MCIWETIHMLIHDHFLLVYWFPLLFFFFFCKSNFREIYDQQQRRPKNVFENQLEN